MTNDILAEACQSQVEQLGRLVDSVEQEQWKIDHDEANQVCSLESVIVICNATCDCLLSLAKCVRRLGPKAMSDVSYHDSGTALLGLFQKAVDSGNQLIEQAAIFDEYTVDGLGELSEKIEAVQLALNDISHAWPILSEESIKDARKDYAAGRFRNIMEIIHDLRNRASGKN